MSRKLFGTDGVRGLANTFPMTPEVAMKIGMAAGRIFTRGEHRHRVVIGKDTRIVGLHDRVGSRRGLHLRRHGRVPVRPAADTCRRHAHPFAARRSRRDDLRLAQRLSDNGIKLFGPDGQKLSDAREQEIESLMANGLEEGLAEASHIGRAKRVDDSQARYIEFAKRTFPRNARLEGLRIVIDCANGAAYKVAPAVLWELGADIVTVGVEPDGFNINLDCGSTAPKRCAARCAKCGPISASRWTATPIAS